MMWSCVEERMTDQGPFPKYERKILFGDMYAERKHALANSPMTMGIREQLQVLDFHIKT